MRRIPRAGAVVLALVIGLAPVPADAKGRRRPPAPQPPGWVVDRARFEPLDAASPLGVQGVGDYRGVIEVVRGPSGVAVINEVGLEDYVRGISEMPASWPPEAQKAQAIAARTYVLNEMGRKAATVHRAVGAHICASQDCQVYTGLAKERADGGRAWTSAVEATAGQVLLHRGKPIRAMYSSSNGGRTTAGGQPYLRSVADPEDARSPLHRWTSLVPLPTVASLLRLPGAATRARRDGDTVTIDWTADDGGGGEVSLPALELREKLNTAMAAPPGLPLAVPSIRFSLGVHEGALRIEGRGWGHGVGMSQWGALGKALRGRRAADILGAYYNGIRPVGLGPERIPPAVRVAVDLGRGDARVVAPGGRFRVVDGTGQPLAHVATGTWRVLPDRRGVRVVPPSEQLSGLEVQAAPQESPELGEPVMLTLRLSAPAVVRVTAVPPGESDVALPQVQVDAGDSTHTLPAASVPGDYTVTVEADAGAGRTASVPVTLTVVSVAAAPGGPAAVEVSRPMSDLLLGDARQVTLPVAGATAALLLPAALLGAALGGRRRRAVE